MNPLDFTGIVTGAAAGMGLATARAFAAAVLWLCSPGASYVIGHGLTVDGGMTVV